MVVISLALFFLPFVNGLIGGLAGGYVAGTVKRGLLAALLPAVAVALGLLLFLGVLGLPLIGLVAGVGLGVVILFSDLLLFVGAAAGGYLATNRR